MFVYLLTNTVNGKYYVGQTKQNILRRFIAHIRTAKEGTKNHHPLYRDINLYGEKSFKIEVLYAADSVESMDACERFLIVLFGAYKRSIGYNKSIGSPNRTGIIKESIPQSLRKREREEYFRENFNVRTRIYT